MSTIATSGRVRAHLQQQLVGVPGLADDLEAAVLEQAARCPRAGGRSRRRGRRACAPSPSASTSSCGSRSTPQRREVKRQAGRDELEDPLGPRQAAQLVLAEVAQLGVAARARRRCRPTRGSARRARPRRCAPPGGRRRRSTSPPRAPACPVWMPIRTRISRRSRARCCAETAAATACSGCSNAAKSSSPRQSTSLPAGLGDRGRGPRCGTRSSTPRYSSPSRWTRPVESSMSLKRSVTTPLGNEFPVNPATSLCRARLPDTSCRSEAG